MTKTILDVLTPKVLADITDAGKRLEPIHAAAGWKGHMFSFGESVKRKFVQITEYFKTGKWSVEEQVVVKLGRHFEEISSLLSSWKQQSEENIPALQEVKKLREEIIQLKKAQKELQFKLEDTSSLLQSEIENLQSEIENLQSEIEERQTRMERISESPTTHYEIDIQNLDMRQKLAVIYDQMLTILKPMQKSTPVSLTDEREKKLYELAHNVRNSNNSDLLKNNIIAVAKFTSNSNNLKKDIININTKRIEEKTERFAAELNTTKRFNPRKFLCKRNNEGLIVSELIPVKKSQKIQVMALKDMELINERESKKRKKILSKLSNIDWATAMNKEIVNLYREMDRGKNISSEMEDIEELFNQRKSSSEEVKRVRREFEEFKSRAKNILIQDKEIILDEQNDELLNEIIDVDENV